MNRPAVVVPLTLAVVVVSALGQTLLKLAVSRLGPGVGFAEMLPGLLRTPAFYAGGFLVTASMLGWIYTLSRADLGFASPFLAMGTLVTLTMAAVILREPQPPLRLAGAAIVTLGMVLVGLAR